MDSIKNWKNYLVRLDKEDDRDIQIPIFSIIQAEEFGNDNGCQLQYKNSDKVEGNQ